MITIFIHIPSVIIGVIIGYIVVSIVMVLYSRFDTTDFQRGYTDGVLDTERKYANERKDGTDEQSEN